MEQPKSVDEEENIEKPKRKSAVLQRLDKPRITGKSVVCLFSPPTCDNRLSFWGTMPGNTGLEEKKLGSSGLSVPGASKALG